MISALILQQALNLTDEETIQQFSFNIQRHYAQWHYALHITSERAVLCMYFEIIHKLDIMACINYNIYS